MVILNNGDRLLQALSDPNVTARAKGVLAYLAAAEGQHMTLDRMESEMAEGVASLRRYIRELEDAGYLERERQNEGQRVWYDWMVTL